MTEDRPELFASGHFRLHSGEMSHFRIDCDALSNEEIKAIALQLAYILPPFSKVEGVPRGGLRLAEALDAYADATLDDTLLIVDDVYTTGASLTGHAAGRPHTAAVIFARRRPASSNVYALFTMHEPYEK